MIRLCWTLPLAALLWSATATAANWYELPRADDGGLPALDLNSASWHANTVTLDGRLTYDPPRADGVKTSTYKWDFNCTNSPVASSRVHTEHYYDEAGTEMGNRVLASTEIKSEPGSVGAQLLAKLCAGHKYDPYAVF